MYWARNIFGSWLEKHEDPFFLPSKRRRIDSGFDKGGARYVYDPKYAAIVDAAMHVEVDNGTRSRSIGEQKAWYFQNVHWDIMGAVSLKVVEYGKYFGLKYSHARRVYPSVEDAAEVAYPKPPEVRSQRWYPSVLRPQDTMKLGFSLVADRSRILLDLTGIPEDDRWVHHDYARTRIVKAVRRCKGECDVTYGVALRHD